MKLYGSTLSANFRKVAAIALELEIDLHVNEVNVYQGDGQSAEYLAQNPLGQIPSLVDGDLVLRESNAIALYLAEKYGNNPIYSNDFAQRAHINQWLFWESSQWQPMLSEVMGAVVGHVLLPAVLPAPENSPAWDADKCLKQLTFLEQHLSTGWVAGETLTIADFAVGAMTTYFSRCQFPFELYPNITRWCNALHTRTSWANTQHTLWR